MATSTKSKRRTSPPSSLRESKGKIKTLKSAKRAVSVARVSRNNGRGPVLMKATVSAASAPPIDPHPQYTKALNFLMSHTDYEKMRVVRYNTTTFSLDRMRTLLKHLGNPQLKFKTAHIAGTKGKGSTCHMLAGMLQSGGLKTGLYTSPHIVDMRERIRLNGDMIPQDELIDLVKRVEPVLKKMGSERPTFFEIFTAM